MAMSVRVRFFVTTALVQTSSSPANTCAWRTPAPRQVPALILDDFGCQKRAGDPGLFNSSPTASKPAG
jgi:hypothetical protein